MIALDNRPMPISPPPMLNRWVWCMFEADRWMHLYRVAELSNPRLDMLRPWCLLGARFPLEHDRLSIDMRVAIPQRGKTCHACAAHVWARVPHPHVGTGLIGVFVGDLFEVVTRDV